MAAENNCKEYLELLVSHGAEINIKDNVSKYDTRVSVGYIKHMMFVINIITIYWHYYYLLLLLLLLSFFIIIFIFTFINGLKVTIIIILII